SLGEARQAAAVDLQRGLRADDVAPSATDQFHAEPVMAPIHLVAQQRDRLIHMTDNQVGIAVVVKVADNQAAPAMHSLKVTPASRGDVREPSLALTPRVRLVRQQHGLLSHPGHSMAEEMTVADHEVFPAVIVVIHEPRPPAHIRTAQTSNPSVLRKMHEVLAPLRAEVSE